MNQYTTQSAFDKVWDHFVVQGKPLANNFYGLCVYETEPGGPRCAVGVLLPDSFIDRLRDGKVANVSMTSGVGAIFNAVEPESLGFANLESNFLFRLQRAHDGAVVPESEYYRNDYNSIRAKLTEVAETFKLSIPE